jgi:ATP-binding cassette subfamily B protein RaxB
MKLPVLLQSNRWECGLACIAMMASAYGRATDVGELRRLAGHALGMTLGWLMEVARRIGFHPRAVRLDIDEARALKLPCIVLWGTQHFVVLKRVTRRAWTIHDPAVGVRRYPPAEVHRLFSGVALELTPGATFERRHEPERLRIRQLWTHAHGIARTLVIVFVLSLAIQVFALVNPLYVQLVVDDALSSHDADLLLVLAVGFGALVVLNALVSHLRSVVVLHAGNALNEQLAANVNAHLLRLPLLFFMQRDIGDVNARFGSLKPVLRLFTNGIVAVLIDGLFATTTLVLLFVYDLGLMAIVVAFLAVNALVRLATLPRLRALTTGSIHKGAAEQTIFIESLRSIVSLKANAMERTRSDLWRNRYSEAVGSSGLVGLFGARVDLARGLATGLESIAVVYAGAQAVIEAELTIGMLYAFIAYKTQFVRAMLDLLDQITELRMLRLHLGRLADLVLARAEPVAETELLRVPFKGKVALEDVTFAYSQGRAAVLDRVSMTIERGSEVGITGGSGCGKSTLVRIVLGLIEPTAGRVTFDGGRPLATNRQTFAARTGVVLQGDSLFSGSIRENVALFELEPDDGRIVECCRLAAIDDDIAGLPMGYDTPLGDMGIVLSAGQIQRLLIARALYKRPRLLILDEATANLDDATRARLNANLRGLDLTLLRITHRADELATCDVVYRLERGKLEPGESANALRDIA